METIFQTLRYLRSVSKYDFDNSPAPASLMEGLVDLLRANGHYDPSEPVGPHGLPLVHALACEREIPVDWLDCFAKNPDESLIFARVGPDTIGTIAFNRAIAKTAFGSSPTLLWWIENTPNIDQQEASGWMEKLSKVKNPSEDSSGQPVKCAQGFIAALMKRGVQLPSDEPGRPQERWSTKEVWWSRIVDEGRLGEMVKAPSGKWRSMRELMSLPGVEKRSSFAYWLSTKEPVDIPVAPHGRRRELLESWVLGDAASSLPVGTLAQRLAAAVVKTEGVLSEIDTRSLPPSRRQPDMRNQLRDLLSYRTPSGMTLRAWFFLSQEKEKNWPENAKMVMGEGFDEMNDWWLGANGEGLVLQKLRAATGIGVGEFPQFASKMREAPHVVLNDAYHTVMSGDPSTHEELASLLVDGMLAPMSSTATLDLAEKVLSQGWIEDGHLVRKVEQAFKLCQMQSCVKNHEVNTRYGEVSYKERAFNIAQELNADVNSGVFAIELSDRDWDTLFNEWRILAPGVGTKAATEISRLFSSLVSLGSRLVVSEGTVNVETANRVSSSPRL